MMISILLTFASRTVKIDIEFSERELFQKMKIIVAILLVVNTSLSTCDVSHILSKSSDDIEFAQPTISTPPPPPRPYAFMYTAGRFPGDTDRAHGEVSDGSGVVRGAFSYIDPNKEIRWVEYVADEKGFHPVLSHSNIDAKQSEAVKLATLKHFRLFNKIAQANANGEVVAPNDSASVAHAKIKHKQLFDRIAADHARIGAEREAERALFESTSEKEIPFQIIEEH